MDLEDELLNLIGHRLRQNMINVAELSTLTLADGGSALTDTARSDIAQIKTEAEEALSIIDDILRVARNDYTLGDLSTIRLSSVATDIVPRCVQKIRGTAENFSIGTVTSGEITFQSNIAALESAITNAVNVLSSLQPKCLLHLSIHTTETAVLLNFQTSSVECGLVPTSITQVFRKTHRVDTLLEMLTCTRLIRACGGQVILLEVENETSALTIQFRLPV